MVAIPCVVLHRAPSGTNRYGYVPTEEEVRSGYLNPYFSDTHMCSGTPEREGNLWTCQAFVSFTTFLLGVAVCVAEFTALQEKEKQIVFMASHTDPPDMEIISHSAKQARKQNAVKWTILVLFLTVLPHPMPGYKRTIYVQSLERNAQYEFEALIVLWMYGRFWHLWAWLKQSEFRRNFEDLSYELGERCFDVRVKHLIAVCLRLDHLHNACAGRRFWT